MKKMTAQAFEKIAMYVERKFSSSRTKKLGVLEILA